MHDDDAREVDASAELIQDNEITGSFRLLSPGRCRMVLPADAVNAQGCSV
jgi:hypothetical protein